MPDRWQRLEEIVLELLELDDPPRQRRLDELCGSDAELRQEVLSLLEFESQSDQFLHLPAGRLAVDLVDEQEQIRKVGSTLGRYEIVSYIGAGGGGTVYLANDPDLGRKVALKRLNERGPQAAEWLPTLEQEARAASALNHPNILTIYEIGSIESEPYIASEYVEGQTLRARLQIGRMEIDEVLDVALQASNALAAAHAEEIVHRDIKPENLMLRPDGLVKVLDFGLATLPKSIAASATVLPTTERQEKPESASRASSPHSRDGSPSPVYGTLRYMSPEQFRDDPPDGRSDLFSLGAVIYEMLAGRPAFDGTTNSVPALAIQFDELVPVERHRPETPPALAQIVAQLLEKDRSERLGSAEELREALQQVADQQTTDQIQPGATASTDSPSDSSNKLRYGLAALVGLLLVLLAVSWSTPFSSNTQVDAIAVLPFAVDLEETEAMYLSEGLANGVIRGLSRSHDLRVMSLNSASRFHARPVNAQQVGKELDVDAVLLGQLAAIGKELVLTAELVDVRDGRVIWGEEFRQPRENLASFQTQLTMAVVKELRPQSASAAIAQREPPSGSNEAYDSYIQGRYHWNRRTEAHLRRAIDRFTHATVADPGYALAHAGIADSYGLLSNYASMDPRRAGEMAYQSATQALELNDGLAEAHTSMGLVLKDHQWRFEEAIARFERAIEIDPSYGTAYQWYAETLIIVGRLEEALAAMQRARQVDPESLIINGELGWILYQLRRYDEALQQLEQTVALDPDFPRTHFFLGRVYERLGRFDQARESTRRAIGLSGGFSLFEASLAYILASSGDPDAAREILERLSEEAETEYVSPFSFAWIHVGLGDTDEAFRWLERAAAGRDSALPNFLRDPQLDPLHEDPRFEGFLAAFGTRADKPEKTATSDPK